MLPHAQHCRPHPLPLGRAVSDALEEAHRLYQEALDASRDQRTQIADDLKFSDPSDPDQWEPQIKAARENDPGGRRPCLVMDQTGQYVANVAGQIEKQPPSLHAIPVGGGADKKAAEQIDGRFRHIEHASRASQHYARALTSAARTGVGYLVIRPEYVDRKLNLQEPRISSEGDPLRVVLDPWSVETDGADANWGFVLTGFSTREFERRWGKRDKKDFGDLEAKLSRDDRKSVVVAEQWFKETKTVAMVGFMGEDGQPQAVTEEEYTQQLQAALAAGVQAPADARQFNDKTLIVRWRRMSGCDVLEESQYPADSIGIVPVYGYIGFQDGRLRYCGIPRRARAAQQAYNYHISEELAYIGTAPKSPWVASKRALKGVETIWDRAAIQSRAVLPYNDFDEDGAIAAPQRTNVATNLTNHAQGAERALHDIQASIGMYQANLGAPSNESSGVAIESRKQQGEASTAHFPAHMAASLGQVGKIVMQMDARLADTRRTSPILGIDGTPGTITVDPEQPAAFARSPDGVSVNPNVGSYGVRVVVGASYSTQRTQTNAAFAEIMRGNPDLAPTVAPFWAQTLDFPGADKFAQAMAAMAPDPVKAILQPEGADQGPDPAKLAQELAQCKQALQEAIQHAKDAQEDADKAIADQADAKRIASVRERELDIEAYNAETNRLKVVGASAQEAELVVRDLIQQMLNNPDPLPGEPAEVPGDGPGMDNTPQHEQAETPPVEAQEQTAEPEEPAEPPQPDPHILALLESQGHVHQALGELAKVIAQPRKKVPVRDKAGNITHVIESMADEG